MKYTGSKKLHPENCLVQAQLALATLAIGGPHDQAVRLALDLRVIAERQPAVVGRLADAREQAVGDVPVVVDDRGHGPQGAESASAHKLGALGHFRLRGDDLRPQFLRPRQ